MKMDKDSVLLSEKCCRTKTETAFEVTGLGLLSRTYEFWLLPPMTVCLIQGTLNGSTPLRTYGF